MSIVLQFKSVHAMSKQLSV